MIALRPASGSPALLTVDAALALTRGGLTLLRSKRAIEAVLDNGSAVLELPCVGDVAALCAELGAAGFDASPIAPDPAPDVRALRERLGLTREQFALRFGLEIETLRNWETGKRAPDTTARSYLRVIANAPEQVRQAYADL